MTQERKKMRVESNKEFSACDLSNYVVTYVFAYVSTIDLNGKLYRFLVCRCSSIDCYKSVEIFCETMNDSKNRTLEITDLENPKPYII